MVSRLTDVNNRQAALSRLRKMRDFGGTAITRGLTDEIVLGFLEERVDLAMAIERGYDAFCVLKETHAEFLLLDETEAYADTQYATLHLALTGATGVTLDFWQKEFGDRYEARDDRVEISADGGASWSGHELTGSYVGYPIALAIPGDSLCFTIASGPRSGPG